MLGRVVAAAVLVAVLTGCATGSSDAGVQARADTTTSAASSPSPSTARSDPNEDSETDFRHAVAEHCVEHFERLATLSEPTDVSGLRRALDGVLESTATWSADAGRLGPPESMTQGWQETLRALEAAVHQGTALAAGPLAELDQHAPVETAQPVLMGQEGVAFDEALWQAQTRINRMLSLDCFDVPLQ